MTAEMRNEFSHYRNKLYVKYVKIWNSYLKLWSYFNKKSDKINAPTFNCKCEHKRHLLKKKKNLTEPKQFNVSLYEAIMYLLLEWKK